MDEEIDIIVFEDEKGQQVEFELQFSFEHNEREYAVLTELAETEQPDDEDDMPDLFIFEIVGEGDDEEFIPVSEEVLDELGQVVEAIFEEVVEHDHDDDHDDEDGVFYIIEGDE